MQKGNPFLYWIKVVSLGIVLGLGLQFAQAWTAPTLAPPAGNVGGPVTLGAGAQYKTGKLGINSPSIPNNALEVGGGGSVLIGGKAYSAATVDTDLASTLATKGYVDGRVAASSSSSCWAINQWLSNGGILSCAQTGHVANECSVGAWSGDVRCSNGVLSDTCSYRSIGWGC